MDDDHPSLSLLDTWTDLLPEDADPVLCSLARLEAAVHDRGVALIERRCRSDPPPVPPVPVLAA